MVSIIEAVEGMIFAPIETQSFISSGLEDRKNAFWTRYFEKAWIYPRLFDMRSRRIIPGQFSHQMRSLVLKEMYYHTAWKACVCLQRQYYNTVGIGEITEEWQRLLRRWVSENNLCLCRHSDIRGKNNISEVVHLDLTYSFQILGDVTSKYGGGGLSSRLAMARWNRHELNHLGNISLIVTWIPGYITLLTTASIPSV